MATRKIVTQLEGMQVSFHQLDGTVPDNRDVRNALWTLAGAKPGTYPIIYGGQTGFVCQGDALQDLIDSGELAGKLVAAKPSEGTAGPVHVSAPTAAPPVTAPVSTSSVSRLAEVDARLTKLAGLQPCSAAAAAGPSAAGVLVDDLAAMVTSLEDATAHLMLHKLDELTGRLEQATRRLTTASPSGSPCAAGDMAAQLEAIVLRMEAALE